MIGAILESAARRWPGDPALSWDDQFIPYGEFHQRVCRLAAQLRRSGLEPGDRLGLVAPNSVLFLTVSWAAARAGLVLVPLDPRTPAATARRLFAHAGVRGIVVHRRACDFLRALEALGPLPGTLFTGGREESPDVSTAGTSIDLDRPPAGAAPGRGASPGPEDLEASDLTADAPAQIYYTSGTTGDPKGVVLTHGNIAHHAELARCPLGLAREDSWGHIAPLFHLADAWATVAVTLVGGCHRVVDRFETARVIRELAEHVTVTNLVPTMIGDLLADPSSRRDYPALRLLLSGGAPIAPSTVERIADTFACEYVQTYGLTETSPFLAMSILPPHLRDAPRADRLRLAAKTGRPLPGVDVRVVRADGTPVAADGSEVGEIVARGPTVTPGYWRDQEQTRRAFRDGWLQTGDLATVDREGFIEIVDRRKDVILSGGETVYSTEVEKVISELPAVGQVAVVGLRHPRWGEGVAAFFTSPADDPADRGDVPGEDEVRAHCRHRLPLAAVPKRAIHVAELPRTGSGKISKRVLRERFDALFEA